MPIKKPKTKPVKKRVRRYQVFTIWYDTQTGVVENGAAFDRFRKTHFVRMNTPIRNGGSALRSWIEYLGENLD